MLSCILSQLNILCTSLVKPCYSKMTIQPLFTVHTLQPFFVFCDVLDYMEAECSKTFSTLSGVRTVIWILLQLDILCTSAVKRYCAKTTIHRSSATCLAVHWSAWKQEKNLPPSSSDLNSCQFLTLESSETTIISTRLLSRWSSEAHHVTLRSPVSETQ